MRMARPFLATLLMVPGCGEPGQREVEVPLYVAGSDLSLEWTAVGDIPVALDRADLAFGPLYFCAGKTAGDLCETARVEWLGSSVVDALDPQPVRVGELSGLTGSVRSWMYDLGISSQLTEREPVVLTAAKKLGGFSFVVSGRAFVEAFEMPFRAQVRVGQSESTELGVPVVRSGSEGLAHELGETEKGLLVRFDPRPWLQSVDFRAFVERASCSPGGPPLVCDGWVESTCDSEGEIVSSRDCAADRQVCIREQGCADEILLETGSEAFRSISNELVSGERPAFTWGYEP
jgi:hypothetical protein